LERITLFSRAAMTTMQPPWLQQLDDDGDSVDIEPMNVPHRSKINGSGSHLDEIYAPTVPSISILDSAEPEEVRERDPQHAQLRMGYFGMHAERRRMHLTGDEDILDHFAQAARHGAPPATE